MSETLSKVAGTLFLALAIGAAVWGFTVLMYQALALPDENYARCAAKAKSLNSDNFVTAGWKGDTCYIYQGKQQTVIKL